MAWARVTPTDAYPPIRDHGLIGDGSAAALVARDGTVAWLCVPRFDDEPLFCSILDRRRGGSFRVSLDGLEAARQHYETHTGVLVTELRATDGIVRVTDCLTLRSGADLDEDVPAARGELLRSVEVLEGAVRLQVAIEPRGGATPERRADGVRVHVHRRPDLDLQLVSSLPLDGLRGECDLRVGDRGHLLLRWGGAPHRHHGADATALLDATRAVWRRWMESVHYDGPRSEMVRRSALTLKMLDFFETGALIAAPTSSLPEAIGGVRNWDYRYAWVRDAAFAVYALRRIGLHTEAWGFLGWALDAVERDGHPRVLYTLDGRQPPPEWVDSELEGYCQSAPVRWGNAAADQRQHDAYGELLDCAWQWTSAGGMLDSVWPRLVGLVEEARRRWDQPDHGIWEVRTPGRVFTYSAAMCHVALDRAARIADSRGLPGDVNGWRVEADRIRAAVIEQAWDPAAGSFTEHLGGGGLDASLLALPLRRVIDARHPRMVATVQAIQHRLGAGDGLLHRYLPDVSPDGLPGHEGAFLLCSFWLVDNLAHQGRLDEAHALYDDLCDRAGPLGLLLPEEVDPTTGAFLGNYPQAFSHVGVISSGMNLARLSAGQ